MSNVPLNKWKYCNISVMFIKTGSINGRTNDSKVFLSSHKTFINIRYAVIHNPSGRLYLIHPASNGKWKLRIYITS